MWRLLVAIAGTLLLLFGAFAVGNGHTTSGVAMLGVGAVLIGLLVSRSPAGWGRESQDLWLYGPLAVAQLGLLAAGMRFFNRSVANVPPPSDPVQVAIRGAELRTEELAIYLFVGLQLILLVAVFAANQLHRRFAALAAENRELHAAVKGQQRHAEPSAAPDRRGM